MTNYEIVKKNNVIFLTGEIDVSNCENFKKQLYNEIDGSNDDLILNFKDFTYIDSAGLGILVGAYKRLKEKGKQLKIVNVSSNIAKLFSITKLDTLMNIE